MYDQSLLDRIGQRLEQLSEKTGRIVAWLTLGMVLLTFIIVVLRYLFATGSIAAQEAITYMHALVFMLGAAYTLRHEAHVRVDIFYRKLSDKGRAWVDLLGTLLLLIPFSLAIYWLSLDYVAKAWGMQEGFVEGFKALWHAEEGFFSAFAGLHREESREAGGLPLVFLLKTALLLMPLLLVLQGVAITTRCLRSLKEAA